MSRLQEEALRLGLICLKLPISDVQVAQLLDYLDLIQKWIKVYNLTAVRKPAEMLTHHLLDSLAVIGPLQKQVNSLGSVQAASLDAPARQAIRLLDVGTGAGLPGVVIAICCPQLIVHCVDAVAKKVAFIQQVAVSLKLPNLLGMHARVEKLNQPYDIVSSRAFASLADFTSGSRAAMAKRGLWMAMKGKYPADEISALPADVQVFHVEQLAVPGLNAERCVVWMRLAE